MLLVDQDLVASNDARQGGIHELHGEIYMPRDLPAVVLLMFPEVCMLFRAYVSCVRSGAYVHV